MGPLFFYICFKINEMNVDKESELVTKYKHLFEPEFIEWKDGLGFLQVTDGWTHIIEGMLATIERHRLWVEKDLVRPNPIGTYKELLNVKISSIKEKFSSLRVYYSVNDEHRAWIEGVVSMATEMAARTCECCSTTDASKLGMTSGWITVICEPCYDKKSAELGDEWKNRNKWMSKDEARKSFRFIEL